jgi:transposase
VLRKRARRSKLLETFAPLPRCVFGMEASVGAYYWARQLRRLGHEPRLMVTSVRRPVPQERPQRHRSDLLREYGLVMAQGVATVRARLRSCD